jgi:hypothetical protein
MYEKSDRLQIMVAALTALDRGFSKPQLFGIRRVEQIFERRTDVEKSRRGRKEMESQ